MKTFSYIKNNSKNGNSWEGLKWDNTGYTIGENEIYTKLIASKKLGLELVGTDGISNNNIYKKGKDYFVLSGKGKYGLDIVIAKVNHLLVDNQVQRQL